jgi:hypothetical protein
VLSQHKLFLARRTINLRPRDARSANERGYPPRCVKQTGVESESEPGGRRPDLVGVTERRTRAWAKAQGHAMAVGGCIRVGVGLVSGSRGAATTRTEHVPVKLLGVWHNAMTKAQWERAGVTRDVGVYTFLVRKAGTVTIYRPSAYRPGCSVCEDFTTTFRPNGSRLTLGSVPVCSFEGLYSWHLSGRTLIVAPVADKRCVVRATFFGGRWKR